MTFKDLDDFLDSSLKLPYKGKVYEIPSPDADTGLWCQNLFSVFTTAAAGGQISDKFADRLKLDDDEELTLYQRVLSPAVYAEMIADKVPWDVLRHMAQTALIWIGADETRAEDFWNTGGRPKAVKKVPQDRKVSAKSARPASTAGTTSRAARKRPAAKKATAGRRSSGTGAT